MTIGGAKMDEKTPLTEGVYYILLALYEPRHGYGIMQYVSELSKGRVELGPGTVYGAIKSLVKRKWIQPLEEEGRKKEYVITEEGKQVVEAEIRRLAELYHNGLFITKGGQSE
jgi:DNA-binding PadR family transcriptional regulator